MTHQLGNKLFRLLIRAKAGGPASSQKGIIFPCVLLKFRLTKIITAGITLLISIFQALFLVHIQFLLLLFFLHVFEMFFLAPLPPQLHFLFLVHLPLLVDPENNNFTLNLRLPEDKTNHILITSIMYLKTFRTPILGPIQDPANVLLAECSLSTGFDGVTKFYL